jgi:hypothetical protein
VNAAVIRLLQKSGLGQCAVTRRATLRSVQIEAGSERRPRAVTWKLLFDRPSTADADDVFQALDACFDWLPIAALVNKNIFCIHSGISQNIGGFSDLTALSKPIHSYVDTILADLLRTDPSVAVTSFARNSRGQGALRRSSLSEINREMRYRLDDPRTPVRLLRNRNLCF